MKSYIVYDSRNGQILKTVSCLDSDIDLQLSNSWEKYLEGNARDDQNYIENNQIIPFPPQPNINYVFNYDTKTWVLGDVDIIAEQIKFKRNSLLSKSDWTQIPNNPLTESQQQAWAGYRQQLRDIPQQPGYPSNVEWPQQPE